MRISTQSFYEQSRNAIGAQQSNLLRIQQQLGSGVKNLAPSDDPLAATRALAVSQSLALNSQYATNRGQANQKLILEDGALQSVTDVLQSVMTQVIEAGNGTLSDADRASIATSLQSSFDQLQGLANTDDGNGQFLFAGFKSASTPFTKQADGSIHYAGDQGQRLMQVDVSRQMAVSDDGRSLFQSVQSGSGYVSSASQSNTGAGVLGTTSVVDMTNPNFGKDFVVSFPTPTTFQIDSAAIPSVSIAPPAAFSPGTPISFGGVQISIVGAPASGDTFNVTTAKNAGTDVFGAINDAIKALQIPVTGGAASTKASLQNALSTVARKLANSYDNVLTVRASVGSRMVELDSLNKSGESRTLTDKSFLSNLQDLDYASAISEFTQRQTALQASQSTFAKVQKLSLFNFI